MVHFDAVSDGESETIVEERRATDESVKKREKRKDKITIAIFLEYICQELTDSICLNQMQRHSMCRVQDHMYPRVKCQ